MIVSFKCLERACRSILRETDKSNSPRREGLPFRRRHDGKCDFSPSPGNIPVQTKRGLEADREEGRKERKRRKKEREKT